MFEQYPRYDLIQGYYFGPGVSSILHGIKIQYSNLEMYTNFNKDIHFI